jgi:hypothetical protein
MILRINRGYFSKQNQQTDLCNGNALCFEVGSEFISMMRSLHSVHEMSTFRGDRVYLSVLILKWTTDERMLIKFSMEFMPFENTRNSQATF